MFAGFIVCFFLLLSLVGYRRMESIVRAQIRRMESMVREFVFPFRGQIWGFDSVSAGQASTVIVPSFSCRIREASQGQIQHRLAR